MTLDKNVAEGKFREDLLHRLRVGAGLRLPPLSAREGFFDDLLPALLTKRDHRAVSLITRSARDALALYRWPGNLRELAGVLDEVVALADGETIRVEHLPSHLQRAYLALPLHERAVGFLLDEVDGGGLPDEHVSWRIAQITQSLARVAMPPANAQLATVGRFLMLLDDSSAEHRCTVEDVKELLALDQRLVRATVLRNFWQHVLTLDVPVNVRKLVRAANKQVDGEHGAVQEQLSSGLWQVSINANPWLRLLREIQDLPLLRGVDAHGLASAFVGGFNLLKLIAPSALETVRADAAAGGFAQLRERVQRFLRQVGDEESKVLQAPVESRSPAKLTRDEWVNLTTSYPTLRATSDATGFDPKTIAKYLRRHGITSPWKAERSSLPRSPSGAGRQPIAQELVQRRCTMVGPGRGEGHAYEPLHRLVDRR